MNDKLGEQEPNINPFMDYLKEIPLPDDDPRKCIGSGSLLERCGLPQRVPSDHGEGQATWIIPLIKTQENQAFFLRVDSVRTEPVNGSMWGTDEKQYKRIIHGTTIYSLAPFISYQQIAESSNKYKGERNLGVPGSYVHASRLHKANGYLIYIHLGDGATQLWAVFSTVFAMPLRIVFIIVIKLVYPDRNMVSIR